MDSSTKSLISDGWYDYELIDSGSKEKLERFGKNVLRRPEPQALWNKSIPEEKWSSLTNAVFTREKQKTSKGSDISGHWDIVRSMPAEWGISFSVNNKKITLNLRLTSSGHIGIFPEQLPNWEFVCAKVEDQIKNSIQSRVLNLFAYTGAASLAALAAGADVVHLDSVRQIIDWTEKNRESSGLPKKFHLVVEDALKFMKREVNRGNKYHGIIMDPPSYGRGPEGEKWIFEEQINELTRLGSMLLYPSSGFLVINWYSLGLSPYVMLNLIKSYVPAENIEFGDMVLRSKSGILLPLGTYLRLSLNS
jgi:23S rRNA (cytosine1962-C5)-methyltransferase